MGRRKSRLNMYVGLAIGSVIASSVFGGHALTSRTHAIVTDISGNASEDQWMRGLLSDLGAPATQANIASLENWKNHETVGWPPADTYVVNNPMNTSLACCGGTVINSAGVMAYPNLSDGLQATADTLLYSGYGDIISQLRSGNGLSSGASAGLLKWSGGAYSSA